jgi:hypothetical protein
MQTITICSSHGTLHIDEHGNVLKVIEYEEPSYLSTIEKVDINGWRRELLRRNALEMYNMQAWGCDILECGLWTRDKQYIPHVRDRIPN